METRSRTVPYRAGKGWRATLGGNRGGKCAVGGAGRRCCPHFTVAVNTGPLPDRVLLDAGADYLLPDMERLAHRFEDLYIQLNM